MAVGALGLTGLGGAAFAGAAGGTGHQATLASGSYLVRAESGHLGALTDDLGARGIAVRQRLQIIDTAVAQLSSAQATALQADPLVASVTPDAKVSLASSSYDAASDANSAYGAAELLGVHSAWDGGATGDGIGVALIDSGVSPVSGLATDGQVVYGPDLSFEAGRANTRNLDTYGHGTAMAGLIVAHDPSAAADSTDPSNYQGMAPGAHVVSIKVADALGRADISQVIAGIDWAVQHADDPGLNIRVLNLSFGTDSEQSYVLDPLAFAAEVAWRQGIVVVVSSGNGGGSTMAMPAADPFLIAVGALDTKDTPSTRDDSIASFTSKGDGSRGLDLVAPGVKLQSLRVPGSYVDTLVRAKGSPGIDNRFFRGSGTSQAAAVTSGLVALLLEQRPQLTPDQVKALLRGSGSPVGNGARRSWSPVRVPHVDDAMASYVGRSRQRFPAANGTGSLSASRGSMELTKDGQKLAGEVDVFGNPVDTSALAASEAGAGSWAGDVWNGASWAGASWAGASWASDNWQGASWTGAGWAGAGWAGAGWAGAGWAGAGWAGAGWAGAGWAGAGWAGEDYS